MKIISNLIKNDPQKPKADGSGVPCKKNTTVVEVNGTGNLPCDLVIEILSRLPVKVLCRFRCVSEQWLHLLSHDKHFIARHSQQSKTAPLLIFRKYCSNKVRDEMDEMVAVELTSTNMNGQVVNRIRVPIDGPVNTFTSCGPLVLLCCPYRIYVCNPSIQELVRVPLSSSVSRYCTVGFGLSSSSRSNDIFKIVHLFPSASFVGDQGMGCEIFCLIDGTDVNLESWRRTKDCPYKVQTHGLSVNVSGFIYWMVSDEANDLNKSILSFDLENEKFESISYPMSYSHSEHNLLFLTGFNNYLALVDSSARTSVTDIWVLKDRKKKTWVKKCSFDLSSLGVPGSNIQIRGVVPCHGNDERGIVFNIEKHGLVHYNMESEIFRLVFKTESKERYKLPCFYYDGFFSLLHV